MALVQGKDLLKIVSPFLQAKRFRGKINIQRPRAPHFEKAVYLQLCQPWFKSTKSEKTHIDLCAFNDTRKKKAEEENPFQQIIAGELLNWFKTSKLVGFYHQNPMNADQQYKAYVLFKKQKMHYKNYGKKTLKMAVGGTPYEGVLDFYVSQNMTVFSPEPKIKEMLKVTKKFPQLILLAAIYEGKLIHKDDIIKLSQIPNLESAQAELVHTMNLASSTLVQNLNTHQNGLVLNLEERRKQLEEDSNKS